jgi:hypothetical protein
MHPRTNCRTWQPINARPHSASPRVTAEPVSPRPERLFLHPTPKPPSPSLSNRYSQKGSFAEGSLPNPRYPCAISAKINRKPELLEHLVCYRKQRAVQEINRKLSPTSRFPFSHSPNPPMTGFENDPETPQSGGRRALTFPSSRPKGESTSVASGFGVWSRNSGAPSDVCEEAGRLNMHKEPADAR